jgi:hypothetical protein
MTSLASHARNLVTATLRQGSMRRVGLAWLPLAVVGALAVSVIVWRLSIDLLPLALTAETRLTEFRGLSLRGLDATDEQLLADLQVEVDRIEAEVRPAARYLRWLAHFSPAVAWLPALDHELAAWAVQVDRLERDLAAASTLLASSSKLLDAYGEAQNGLLAQSARPSSPLLNAQASDLQSTFATALEGVLGAPGAASGHAPAISTPRVRDAMALLDEVEERMVTALRIGQQASGLLVELLEIADLAQPLVGQFIINGQEPEQFTVEDLKTTLADLDVRLRFTLARSAGLARLIADSEQSEPLLDRMGLMRDLLGVLLSVNRATTVGLQVVEPAIQGARDSTGGLLGADGSLVPAFNGVADHEDSLREAVALLEDAEQTLLDLRFRGDHAQPLRGIEDLAAGVSLLRGGLQLVMDIGPIGAELLGGDAIQRYLVLGQSSDELRATGGYVSSIWLVTFESGGLADVQYYDSVRVDDWERLSLYPRAPSGLEEHMNARVWLLRDVSWEPDFPTTARTAADMYRIGQRQEVDGVAAINQWTLLALIQGLGSIPSPGDGAPMTPRNLLSTLERGRDEHGRAYMDMALQGVLDRLEEPMSLSKLIRLASAINSSLESRDLLLFLDDPEVQAVIEDNGWDGSVRRDATDYLYVVDSNVGWSKADRNIERTVRYQVDLRREERARISLNLGYNNHSGPGSSGCEPQWLNEGTNYDQLKNACYWNYWRVYVPLGARLLSNTPLALPEYSVSVETGRGRPGEDTVDVSSSYDRTVYSGLFAVGAGEIEEVDLVYDLPPGVVRREGDDIHYRLLLQKQPGVREREVRVEFFLPAGYLLTSSSIAPAYAGDARVGFTLLIERDAVLSVEFTRSDNGAR